MNVPSIRIMTRNTEEGRVFYILNLADHPLKDIDLFIENANALTVLDLMSLEMKDLDGDKLSFEGGESFVLVEKKADNSTAIEIKEHNRNKLDSRFDFKEMPVNIDFLIMPHCR